MMLQDIAANYGDPDTYQLGFISMTLPVPNMQLADFEVSWTHGWVFLHERSLNSCLMMSE